MWHELVSKTTLSIIVTMDCNSNFVFYIIKKVNAFELVKFTDTLFTDFLTITERRYREVSRCFCMMLKLN
jgi:hypothetical protein